MLDEKILENWPDEIKSYKSIAIPIDTETFDLYKKVGGGQTIFDNGIFHLIQYKGSLYIYVATGCMKD